MIPYAAIDTVFLDAGNTLISMNFGWIAAELGAQGLDCDAETLRRAEAAARPATSEQSVSHRGVESSLLFAMYLREVLTNLPDRLEARRVEALVRALAPRLKQPGQDHRLWSWLMPGVEQALAALAALGLTLAVVSNSDGSVERALRALGLTRHLSAVFDSEIVGFEKPDPRIFRHALERIGADPARTLHVGDMYYQDVAGARAAGLHGLLLDPFDDWSVGCERCPDLTTLVDRLTAARGVAVRRDIPA